MLSDTRWQFVHQTHLLAVDKPKSDAVEDTKGDVNGESSKKDDANSTTPDVTNASNVKGDNDVSSTTDRSGSKKSSTPCEEKPATDHGDISNANCTAGEAVKIA